MKHEILVPGAGESVTEAFIGKWHKSNGTFVKKGDSLVDLESQKATMELESEFTGRLEILVNEPGAKINIGQVIATIDDAASASEAAPSQGENRLPPPASPSVRKILTENNLRPEQVQGSGKDGRILKEDIKSKEVPASPSLSSPVKPLLPTQPITTTILQYIGDPSRGVKRTPATRIRREIAKNLVLAQHTAAILTTFNEIDMSAILDFRAKNKEAFQKKHGVALGMVGFFAVACAKALKEYPLVNSVYTGEEIVSHDYVDLSIAVSTERGLVVPIIRDMDKLDLAGFEKRLNELSTKARDGKLSIPEMTGGTFTISNGGVFGSLLSTPLLNMPQAAILGLHKTEKRAVVVDDQIVIRPMMYVALSYDHRLIDGKEAVQFLTFVKAFLEKPQFSI